MLANPANVPKRGTHWIDINGQVFRIVCVTDDGMVVYHDAYNHKIWCKQLSRWRREMAHLKNIGKITSTGST